MSEIASLVEEYSAGPQTLRQAIAGMTRAQLQARPVEGRWSTLDVVCHIADFEPIMADRMKRMLAEERPTLLGANENRFVAALAYDQRDLEEELQIIELTRRQLARILRAAPADVLKREGVHNERGPQTLEQMLRTAIRHIPHHVRFIAEKRQALGC